MRRLVPILPLFLLFGPASARAADGFRVFESTAASVNGEVLFVSDVAREACFSRCAAMPGSGEEVLSFQEARDHLILDTLALQEQRKLLLGAVDNAVFEGYAREAESRMSACSSPCNREIAPAETREWIRRKLLLRDFYTRRVAVFVEVKDDDVRKEAARRGGTDAEESLEQVREEMLDARIAQEIRNWQSRAASKSRLILSPLEGR